jgi:hypothetical protein
MTDVRMWKENDAALSGLRTYDADPLRIERIRVRCIAGLSAHADRRQAPHSPGWQRWLVPAIAIGISAFYLVVALESALALLRRPY